MTSDGGSPVIARRTCWSTSSNPTTLNETTSDGTGTGEFSSNLTGLTQSTQYFARAYATNSVGTSYGNQVSFNSLANLPSVITAVISDITETSATTGGNITGDGGAPVSGKGVCWSISPNPTLSDNHTSDGIGSASFISSMTGLTSNTLYHVRAYATNIIGTSYGNELTFTTITLGTVITAPVSNIQQTTCTGGGEVTGDGGSPVTARGVCWSISPGPTIADSKTTDGSGMGEFESEISGLTGNTLFYLKAYATNGAGTTYGEQITFTTAPVMPQVSTLPVTNITLTSATAGGNVTGDGGAAVTSRGVCWSLNPEPGLTDSIISGGTGTGIFACSMTDLTENTTYHLRAFATNSIGTSFGDDISFTTITLATVSTAAITNITQSTATGGGNVTDDGRSPVTARGICWGSSSNPTISNNKTIDGNGMGNFTSNLTGLTGNNLYYVRTYATNSVGTAYGNEVTFTSSPVLPTIETSNPSNITTTTITTGGNITSGGGTTVTFRGVCWGTSANPSLSNNYTNDGSGTGTFVSSLTSLTSNTIYHVRAYAVNNVGTAYGSDLALPTLPVVSTTVITSIAQTTANSGGTITVGGGATITARGVCWNTTGTPTITDSHTSNGTGTGSFTSNITGLTGNTLYYARAYATNSSGTSYGLQGSFTTSPVLATISTTVVTYITLTTAMSGGNVISNGGGNVTAKGVCWHTSPNPTVSNNHTTNGSGNGAFTSSVSGLTANTTYYLKSYATNSAGTAYGDQIIFTTLLNPILPVVATNPITNVTATGASTGGIVLSDGGATVNFRGICWSLSPNPTTADNKTVNGNGTGTFYSYPSGLSANTAYYFRAYAMNSVGTSYGDELIINTTFYIGNTYAGGIIFYIEPTWQHGLVVADTNFGPAQWGCSNVLLGVTSTAIGSGQANTAAITAACTTPGIPARVCYDLVLNGYDDWFLPSSGELQEMANHYYQIGYLHNNLYWSSSEDGNTYYLAFGSSGGLLGSVTTTFKSNPGYIRPVRSF